MVLEHLNSLREAARQLNRYNFTLPGSHEIPQPLQPRVAWWLGCPTFTTIRGGSLLTPPSGPAFNAKCVVIDRKAAFVPSANFIEAKQVSIWASPGFAVKLARHFETLAAEGILQRVPGGSS